MRIEHIKISLISGFLLSGFVGGVLAQYISPNQVFASSDIPTMIVGVTFIFLWYYYDSNQIKYKRTPFLNVAVIALSIVAIPYYLFRSRGMKSGFLGIIVLIILAVVYWALDICGRYLIYYLLQS